MPSVAAPRQKRNFNASWMILDAFSVLLICAPEELLMFVPGAAKVG